MRRSKPTRGIGRRALWAGVCALLLAGGLLGTTQASADPAPPQAGETVPAPQFPIIGGYLLQGTPNFSKIQMDLVTGFYWAFSNVQNGQCTTATTAGINAVVAERQLYPNLKVIRSIGGWGAGGFPSISATDAARKTFVASCIQSFVANGATDGFDLDWEYPVSGGLPNIASGPQDKQNFNLLVDEFRRQLNAYADAHSQPRSRYWMTAAIPAGRWEDAGDGVHGAPYDVSNSYDLATIGRTLNSINLMSYDMGNGYTPVSMFNQPLYPSPLDTTGDPYNSMQGAINYFEAAGVPADKITLGAEFTLQRGYQTTDTLNNGRFRPWTATGCGTATMTNALKPGSTTLLNWDSDVESPYIWDPAAKRFCSYENAQSLGIHAQWAKAHGLNGVMSWELSGDTQNSQLRAIARAYEPAKVAGAPAPTITPKVVTAVKGQEFTGEVAHLTGSGATSLTAEINWGDNTHSAATVTSPGTGEFSIAGTHTYASTGSYAMTVAIVDPDPLNSRMVNTTAAVGTVAPVQQTITTNLKGGQLTLSVPSNAPINLGDVTLNGQDQLVTGQLNSVQVVDARGTNDGWSLSGQVTDFQGTGAAAIPAADLGWTPSASVAPGALNLVHNKDTSAAVVAGHPLVPGQGLSSPSTLCLSQPGVSTGTFNCGGGLQLGIPSDTPAGTYTGILTVTLV